MRGTLRNAWMRFVVALALASVLVSGMVATAYASSVRGTSAGPRPYPFTCEFISGTQDKNGGTGTVQDPNTRDNYTITVYTQFAYDGSTWCYTQSMAVISMSGGEAAGTLHLMLSNCTNQVDSVSPNFPPGPGTFTFFGNHASAQGCADASAYLVSNTGIRVPQSGFSDSGKESA